MNHVPVYLFFGGLSYDGSLDFSKKLYSINSRHSAIMRFPHDTKRWGGKFWPQTSSSSQLSESSLGKKKFLSSKETISFHYETQELLFTVPLSCSCHCSRQRIAHRKIYTGSDNLIENKVGWC